MGFYVVLLLFQIEHNETIQNRVVDADGKILTSADVEKPFSTDADADTDTDADVNVHNSPNAK